MGSPRLCFLTWISFVGAFAGALSMAERFDDPRTYLKAFVLGLGATGLLHTPAPSGATRAKEDSI